MLNHYLMGQVLLLNLMLSSCTFFIQTTQPRQENWVIHPVTSRTFCTYQDRKKDSLVSIHQSSQEGFKRFLKNLDKNKIHLSFTEKIVAWSLVQMAARPDQSSPTSRFQFVISTKGKKEYFDFKMNPKFRPLSSSMKEKRVESGRFKSNDDPKKHAATTNPSPDDPIPFPYLHALHFLLKKDKADHGLSQISGLLRKHFPFPLVVEEEFKTFLNQSESQLYKYPVFNEHYFKEDELLHTAESLPLPSYQKVTEKYEKDLTRSGESKLYSIDTTLFPLPIRRMASNILKIECSYDMKIYEDSLMLLDKDIPPSNLFGLQNARGDYFLAVSFQSNKNIRPIMDTIFIHATPTLFKFPICLIDSSSDSNATPANDLYKIQISLLGSHSRDPGQHIFHLLEREIENVHELKSFMEWSERIEQARHLFLSNPMRLIFESRRGSTQQLDRLLSLDIPVYHSPNMGNIWSHLQIQNFQEFGFIIDGRNKGQVSCF